MISIFEMWVPFVSKHSFGSLTWWQQNLKNMHCVHFPSGLMQVILIYHSQAPPWHWKVHWLLFYLLLGSWIRAEPAEVWGDERGAPLAPCTPAFARSCHQTPDLPSCSHRVAGEAWNSISSRRSIWYVSGSLAEHLPLSLPFDVYPARAATPQRNRGVLRSPSAGREHLRGGETRENDRIRAQGNKKKKSTSQTVIAAHCLFILFSWLLCLS